MQAWTFCQTNSINLVHSQMHVGNSWRRRFEGNRPSRSFWGKYTSVQCKFCVCLSLSTGTPSTKQVAKVFDLSFFHISVNSSPLHTKEDGVKLSKKSTQCRATKEKLVSTQTRGKVYISPKVSNPSDST